MNQLNNIELEQHFHELLNTKIKSNINVEPTFQDLSGYPNYENVLSNLYKFYFEFEYHGLADLFIQSLNDCLVEQDAIMDDIFCEREVNTKNGGRIDLVLFNDSSNKDATKVIIIENKIYHTLENDLTDYWNTFDHIDDKIGIVFSLEEISVNEPFINITHIQFINKVKSRIGDYLSSANSKYLILLNDFLKYIENFYINKLNMDAIKFLFDNGQKVDELVALRKQNFDLIREMLVKVIQHSDEWTYNSKSRAGINISTESGIIVFYIGIDNLFSNKTFTIESWLKGKSTIESWINIGKDNEFESLAKKNKIILISHKTIREWTKIGQKEYNIKNYKQVISIDKLVVQILKEDWTKIANRLNKLL